MELATIKDIRPNGVAIHGDDSSTYAEFYIRKVFCAAETEEKGEVVNKDVVFIKMVTPGDKNKVIDRPAKLIPDRNSGKPSDAERFSRQWERFQAGEKQKADGTPLSALGLGESELKNYEFNNVLTVEQMAQLPDFLLDNLGIGARGVRTAAQKYLENKTVKVAEVDALKAENADLTARLEKLEKLMAEKSEEPKKTLKLKAGE